MNKSALISFLFLVGCSEGRLSTEQVFVCDSATASYNPHLIIKVNIEEERAATCYPKAWGERLYACDTAEGKDLSLDENIVWYTVKAGRNQTEELWSFNNSSLVATEHGKNFDGVKEHFLCTPFDESKKEHSNFAKLLEKAETETAEYRKFAELKAEADRRREAVKALNQ